MTSNTKAKPDGHPDPGPKYFVTVENLEYPWDKATITTEEIAELGKFDAGVGVVEVDVNGDERTLAAAEVISLKPGHGFGKKFTWKRG